MWGGGPAGYRTPLFSVCLAALGRPLPLPWRKGQAHQVLSLPPSAEQLLSHHTGDGRPEGAGGREKAGTASQMTTLSRRRHFLTAQRAPRMAALSREQVQDQRPSDRGGWEEFLGPQPPRGSPLLLTPLFSPVVPGLPPGIQAGCCLSSLTRCIALLPASHTRGGRDVAAQAT